MQRLCLILTVILLLILLVGCQSNDNVSDTTVTTVSKENSNITSSIVPDVTTTPPVTTEKIPSTENHPITEPLPPAPEGIGLLTSLTLPAKDNPTLAKDLSFVIDEKARTATLTLDYQTYADLATLSAARLTAVVDGCGASFTRSAADGSVNLMSGGACWVTDENGLVKSYQLVVNRTVYQLPIVNITLSDGKNVDSIDRNLTTQMSFSLDCSAVEGYQSIGTVSGTIRGRGNSTWLWDKKPYKIKLDKKASLLGLNDNRDWILLANYADKSLIRNTLAYEMGRVLDNITWSPHSYPVDLFVNGQYRGVYSLGEHMEVASGRVDIEEGSDPDTDYLLEIGGMAPTGDINGVHYFHTDGRLVRFATFKSPDAESITKAQKAFITDYFQKAENAIKRGEGYEDYIDVDSFVDWIILHELSYNIDSCFRRSCFLTKEKGGKIKMGPIWDFDLAFGNFSRDNKNYDNWVTVGSNEEDAYVQYNWCTYLLRDKEFCQRLAERWKEIRDRLSDVANDTIDRYGALLDSGSQQENFAVWKIWNIRAGYQSKWCSEANTYQKQLQYLKNFLEKRAKWLDGAIPKLPN